MAGKTTSFMAVKIKLKLLTTDSKSKSRHNNFISIISLFLHSG